MMELARFVPSFGRHDIDRKDQQRYSTLKRVAQAIVDYRESYGLFTAADEIVFVRGIGDSTFENNKGDILVK